MIRTLLASLVKTPGMKIPGVFLCLCFLYCVPVIALAECGSASGELFQVARVSDGDTLKLADGRSVRVLGINAPEIAHGQKAGQPFGLESRAAAQAFIDAGKGTVRLGFERETHDHYGRLLAHVYDSRGRSLAASQLRAGMALQIAVPPNTAQMQCLDKLELAARNKSVGLWRDNYWRPLPTRSLRGDEAGFRFVRGRIAKVDINSAVWLELDGKLVARVAKKDWPLFADQKTGWQTSDWLALKGRLVELRGWITSQKSTRSQQFKPLVLQLRSPLSIKVIAE
ncbi:MAG: thermonuclease family protein [Cellvibrio sp.]|uniref:thermonuclease family protein n=1 Tax=Cellvibrio sp. TaxID=1965322 RepID=UPI0027208A12|nr:thermonuclease family protein [Cellvibrio sp.]